MGEIAPICVVPLGERADVIPTLAAWLYEQWGYFHNHDSVERRTTELQGRLDPAAVPVAFVALSSAGADASPIGTASLTADDLETRPDLTPALKDSHSEGAFRRSPHGWCGATCICMVGSTRSKPARFSPTT